MVLSSSTTAVVPLPRWGRLTISRHICGGGATIANDGLFDEPIGSACERPQGGYRKPPARLVVMTGIGIIILEVK